MERTPEVILSEIKDALWGIAQKVEELENVLISGPSEFTEVPDGFGLGEVDLDIELAEEILPEEDASEAVPAAEPVTGDAPGIVPEIVPEAIPGIAPEVVPEAAPEVVPEEKPVSPKATRKSQDKTRAWMVDEPGAPVINILSAISLNDRILFINALFDKDPVLFQNTIRLFNSYATLDQVTDYIAGNFPKWNLNSQTVYRFMMAVRRKIQ